MLLCLIRICTSSLYLNYVIFTLLLIHDLLSHILIDILAVFFVLVHNYKLRDVIRLEEIDSVECFESGRDSRKVHNCCFEFLVIDCHFKSYALTHILALPVQFQLDNWHLTTVRIVEVFFDETGHVLGETNDKLILSLEDARH